VQFLGQQLGSGQLLDLARDLLAAGLQLARGLADWQGLAEALAQAARALSLSVGRVAAGTRLRWLDEAPEGVAVAGWQQALLAVELACARAMAALEMLGEMAPDFVRLHERASRLAERAACFAQPCAQGAVRWLEAGGQLRLVESPLDIAETVRTRLLQADDEVAQGEGARARAWVFTSATLGDDEGLRWFTEPCGLVQAQRLRVDSPFDYARQSALYLPRGMAAPADPAHSAQVAALAAQAASRLGGRTLVLTTTLRALRAIGDALAAHFAGSPAISVLVQGQAPKRRLMERFRAAGEGAGCILVASASFWEGLDVPGDALQLVVIDKLPFPPPGDPLVQARARQLALAGRSAFADHALPEAAVALKQGAGRLIRSESDRGILVVCDTRLATMGYGRRLLAALPPMRRLGSEEEFQAALDALTTASTTDPTAP
jgi:ATP-dependent DNA helicase DinG